MDFEKVFKTENPNQNMKRELSTSIFAILIIAAALFAVYYLGVGPTGLAIFNQQTKTDFDKGNYSNVLYNGSAIVLAGNQTTGNYTSQVFDAGNSSTWNNLTWQGSGNLGFQVRNCSAPYCSDANFSSINLTNLNLTGRYFQYQISFNSNSSNQSLFLTNVTIDYSVIQQAINTSVSLLQPLGVKNSTSGIPINFNAVGNNLTCQYNVQNSSGVFVIANVTLSNCGNSTFNLGSSGSYTFNLFVTGLVGNVSQTSNFTVTLPPQTNTTPTITANTTPQTNTTNTTPITNQPVQNPLITEQPIKITKISLGDIAVQNINQGATAQVTLSVQNTGTTSVSRCTLSFTGDNAKFASSNEGSKDINAGGSASYPILLNISENTNPGSYTVGLSVTCSEVTANKDVTINVIQKTFDFKILNTQRTTQDRVKVDYSIKELLGANQNVSVFFYITNSSSGLRVANASQNSSVNANKTSSFSLNIPINKTLKGNLSLSAEFNSLKYSSSVLQPITLGAPTGGILSGLAVLGNLGTGNALIIVAVIIFLLIVFFVIRRMRKP